MSEAGSSKRVDINSFGYIECFTIFLLPQVIKGKQKHTSCAMIQTICLTVLLIVKCVTSPREIHYTVLLNYPLGGHTPASYLISAVVSGHTYVSYGFLKNLFFILSCYTRSYNHYSYSKISLILDTFSLTKFEVCNYKVLSCDFFFFFASEESRLGYESVGKGR